MATEDFCLKWNDHHSIFFSLAETLCREDLLTDVTLATSTRTFPAHRLVLSVCSSFFKNLFSRPEFSRTASNNFVFLKDVESSHLEMLLSYMYRGEINVEEQELMGLLNTARGLGIKGLSEVNDLGTSSSKVNPGLSGNNIENPKKRQRSEEVTVVDSLQAASFKSNKEEVIDVAKHNLKDNYGSIVAATDENIQIVDPTMNQGVEDDVEWYGNGDEVDGGGYDQETYESFAETYDGAEKKAGFEELSLACPECPKQFASTWHLRRHVQTHSKQKRFRCDLCGKFFSRNDNLKSHQKSVHGVNFPPTLPTKSSAMGELIHN